MCETGFVAFTFGTQVFALESKSNDAWRSVCRALREVVYTRPCVGGIINREMLFWHQQSKEVVLAELLHDTCL